jgi:hypothetical protein
METKISTFDSPKAKAVIVIALGIGTIGNGAALEVQAAPVPRDCILEISSLNEAEQTFGSDEAGQWAEFQALVKDWRSSRGARSTMAEMAMLPAYQSIIGMGRDVVPLILAELKSEGDAPDHWFWALAAITRANPVLPNSRGKIREMAKAWLEWGEKAGYV